MLPGEFKLIDRIRSGQAGEAAGLRIGIGDDAAVIEPGRWVVTTDLMVDRVHFRLDWSAAGLVGRRLLRANLSDLAAMGARPRFFLLGLVLPPDVNGAFFEEFLSGIEKDCQHYGIQLVGGDLSRGETLMASITALGLPVADPVSRQGAREGDRLILLGNAGLARKGWELLEEHSGTPRNESDLAGDSDSLDDRAVRAYLLPSPLVAEGTWLAQEAGLHAMIDVSDGLGADLMHLLEASGCGAQLELAPRQDDLDGHPDWLSLVLEGGEDFALLAAVSEKRWPEIESAYPFTDTPLRSIGRVSAGPREITVHVDGQLQNYTPKGFDHFR